MAKPLLQGFWIAFGKHARVNNETLSDQRSRHPASQRNC